MTGSDQAKTAFSKGLAAHRDGHLEEAAKLYRRALRSAPRHAAAHSNLGAVLSELGEREAGLEHLARAVEIDPRDAVSRFNLGHGLLAANRPGEAISHLQTARTLDPENIQIVLKLGNALNAARRYKEAETVFRSLSTDPSARGEAIFGLGLALKNQGRVDEALTCNREAVERFPDSPAAHFNYGTTLLLNGQFEEGWRHFAWRMRSAALAPTLGRRHMTAPEWRGEPLEGKRILIHGEQGYGDNIQFVRYLAALKARGGFVIFVCKRELRRLFESLAEIDLLVTPEPDGAAEMVRLDDVPHDFQSPLLDLPHAFKTTLDTIPAAVPYLTAPSSAVREWKRRIADGAAKVGLVWGGNPIHPNEHTRSIAFETIAPLLDLMDIGFFSLQKDKAVPSAYRDRVADVGPELTDFADTAAVLECLDLVITVDTAVAHLAGALGRPVWTLVSFVPDWRWLRQGKKTPWYPTMRLYRQTRDGDWGAVVRRLEKDLAAFTA